MGLMFEVAEGGFLDIDVRIVGPDGKTIHQVGCFFDPRESVLPPPPHALPPGDCLCNKDYLPKRKYG
jgi:hypothetical protein